MSEPYIGEIQMFGFNFAPRGWANCDGQLLPIAQYSALFSLLGTTFGGDGRTTFALPDLRGRVAVHVGTGGGISPVSWGERFGQESSTLTVQNMPSHTHTATLRASGDAANTSNPDGNALALAEAYSDQAFAPSPLETRDGSVVNDAVGNNQTFSNSPPSLGIYHCIALTGIFPSRN